MTHDDLRRALLLQRRLFGSNEEMAAAIGVSGSALSHFLGRRNCTRSDSRIVQALGVEVAVERVVKLKLKNEI